MLLECKHTPTNQIAPARLDTESGITTNRPPIGGQERDHDDIYLCDRDREF